LNRKTPCGNIKVSKSKESKLELKIKELEEKINNTNVKNIYNYNTMNTTNNIINNTFNITINTFGNEDLVKLTQKEILNIINKCYMALPSMVKKIHIDIPENRNVYIPNKKEPYALVYDNQDWRLINIDEIVDKMITNNTDRLIDFIEIYKDQIPKKRYNRLTKMLNDCENGKLNTKYADDIKLILMNHKKLIKDYYQKNGVKLID
tara:strand:- start:138 stop:755 length:618 start_codon:yes stop_codon:yes gene_type:complete